MLCNMFFENLGLNISLHRDIGQGGQNHLMDKGCNMIYLISIWMSKTGILEGTYVSYAFHTRFTREL